MVKPEGIVWLQMPGTCISCGKDSTLYLAQKVGAVHFCSSCFLKADKKFSLCAHCWECHDIGAMTTISITRSYSNGNMAIALLCSKCSKNYMTGNKNKSCAVCQAPAIWHCRTCKYRKYCSVTCQIKDWSSHKQNCYISKIQWKPYDYPYRWVEAGGWNCAKTPLYVILPDIWKVNDNVHLYKLENQLFARKNQRKKDGASG